MRRIKKSPGAPSLYEKPMESKRILLPAHQIEWLEAEAEKQGIPMAQIIRDLIDQKMSQSK